MVRNASRTDRLRIRLSEEEKELIRLAAEASGCTRADGTPDLSHFSRSSLIRISRGVLEHVDSVPHPMAGG